MKIAVLSDLHLGAKDGLDRFARAPDAESRLLAFIERLEAQADRVVLCGDIFETLRGAVPGPSRAALQAAMAAYPQITRRIQEDPRYVLIQGNHDTLTGELLGGVEFHREFEDGLNLLFLHGHQVDRLAKGQAPLSRLGIWAGGILERCHLPVTHHVDARRDGPNKPESKGHPTQRERDVAALGKSMGADIVITGHTHRLAHHELDGVVYLNSGTCLSGRTEAIFIDTAGPRFELVRQ